MTEHRVPCPSCKAPVVEGARKCRACKAWIGERPRAGSMPGVPLGRGSMPSFITPREQRFPRAAVILAGAVATVAIVLMTGRKSSVGDAPPLTALAPEGTASSAAAPTAFGPDDAEGTPAPTDPKRRWRVRDFRIGDVHPLDIAFNPKGTSVYVSADDATLREYKLKTGELIHKASMPAQGDAIASCSIATWPCCGGRTRRASR